MQDKNLIPVKQNVIGKLINFIKSFFRKKKTDNIDKTEIQTNTLKNIDNKFEEYNINYIYKKVKEGTISLDDLTINDYLEVIQLMNKELLEKEQQISEEKNEIVELNRQLEFLEKEKRISS